jgi:hypothetical protein
VEDTEVEVSVMKRFLMVVVMVWWLMTGWGYGGTVVGGPFNTFRECNYAGMHLPWQYSTSGWHCDIGKVIRAPQQGRL